MFLFNRLFSWSAPCTCPCPLRMAAPNNLFIQVCRRTRRAGAVLSEVFTINLSSNYFVIFGRTCSPTTFAALLEQ